MADIQISENEKRITRKVDIIFAFPGMGKTPYALNHKGVIDADFGYFRNAFKVPKEQESKLFKPYARMIKFWVKDGYLVLSNQPDIMQFVNPKRAICFLPLNLSYSASKMGVPVSQIHAWVLDWYNRATNLGIRVVMTSIGLDTLLSK